MSAYLTWPEARDMALAGTPVRRDGWPTGIMMGGTYSGLLFPTWLEHRIGLWIGTDSGHAFLRVCDPGIFALAEFYADDWTTDPPGTTRDVCQVDPPARGFVPPGIVLTGIPGMTSIDLHADLGAADPAGVFMIEYFLDGVQVGSAEATGPGRYTVTVPFSWSSYSTAGRARAWIDVRSSLPLPAWTGHAEWGIEFPAASYFTINLGTYFPGDYRGALSWYGAPVVFGPYSSARWVYAHAADGPNAACANDDLAINGTLVNPDNIAGYVWPQPPYTIWDPGALGGQTKLLLFLPAGTTFTLNVWNGSYGGECGASGLLRLYNRPI